MPPEGLSEQLELLPRMTSPAPVPRSQPGRFPWLSIPQPCPWAAWMCQQGSPGHLSRNRVLAGASLPAAALLSAPPKHITRATARLANKHGQDLGLANSLLPTSTQSPAWGQCGRLPSPLPIPTAGSAVGKALLRPLWGAAGEGGHGAALQGPAGCS